MPDSVFVRGYRRTPEQVKRWLDLAALKCLEFALERARLERGGWGGMYLEMGELAHRDWLEQARDMYTMATMEPGEDGVIDYNVYEEHSDAG